ncbi:Aminotransferase class I/II-fold pyridoxal phosphate-dependent enzyme [Planctomycetales bacterium 10988]|nr:Aminotransferase class I/II-fold pyridoxal phosphate-dependent enzyme [Planctomycetales bacterium 10988]
MTVAFDDFRSDTVTRPTARMRQVMASAEVGDDVMGDDPSILALEELVANRLGKEAALFVPSGTMSNQLGIKVHTQPGDELLCEQDCHIYNYEQGAAAQLSGVTTRCLYGKERGILTLADVQDHLLPADDHCVRTRLVALENTHNRAGGRIQPYDEVEAICHWAHENGLSTHLDGARLWNACVASGIALKDWSQHFDTVNVCFSKGLGAPVGSALAGPRDLIRQARRIRKMLGGGMRQAGILAAAAHYAIENHFERLAEDHQHAQLLAETIRELPGLTLVNDPVDTNLVFFDVDSKLDTAKGFVSRLREKGTASLSMGTSRIRMCTHLDVDREAVERACENLAATVEDCQAGKQKVVSSGTGYAG